MWDTKYSKKIRVTFTLDNFQNCSVTILDLTPVFRLFQIANDGYVSIDGPQDYWPCYPLNNPILAVFFGDNDLSTVSYRFLTMSDMATVSDDISTGFYNDPAFVAGSGIAVTWAGVRMYGDPNPRASAVSMRKEIRE